MARLIASNVRARQNLLSVSKSLILKGMGWLLARFGVDIRKLARSRLFGGAKEPEEVAAWLACQSAAQQSG
jgi:hypothetical protein